MRLRALGKWTSRFVVLMLAATVLTPAFAQGNPFSSGTVRFSGSASASSGLGGDSFQLGVGAGYYVLDGLELGLDARSWFGGNYDVYEVEPSITYVFANSSGFTPYGGALYRRTFIEGREDLSAYGGRLGLLLQQSYNMYVRAGVTGIWYQDCDEAVQSECSEFYPEVSVGFYF